MARKTNIYKVFPLEPTESANWTKLGTGTVQQELANTEVDHTGTPSTAKGLKTAVASAKVQGKFSMPTLAAGEAPIKGQFWLNGKVSTVAEDMTAMIVNAGSSMKVETTTQEWHSSGFGFTGISMIDTAARRETLEYQINRLKGTATVYEAYLELETKTETSNGVTQLKPTEHGGLSNAESKFTTGATVNKLRDSGNFMICAVICEAGTPPASLIDSAGNTWQKDGEESNGTVAVAIFSAKITKGVGETITLTATVSGSGIRVLIPEAIEITPIAEANRVSASSGAKGEGTAVTAGSVTPRATQGDVVFCAWGATDLEGLTFTSKSPLTQIGYDTSSVLMAALAQNITPTEGEAFTGEGTLGHSATWAGIAVSYKVLPNTGTSMSRSGEDSATVSDSATRSFNAPRSPSESLVATDSAARTVAQARSGVDTAAVGDQALRAVGYGRLASESTAVSDSALRSVSCSRTSSEATTIADTVQRTTHWNIAASESMTITDSASVVVEHGRRAGRIRIASRRQARIHLASHPAAVITISSRRAARIKIGVG